MWWVYVLEVVLCWCMSGCEFLERFFWFVFLVFLSVVLWFCDSCFCVCSVWFGWLFDYFFLFGCWCEVWGCFCWMVCSVVWCRWCFLCCWEVFVDWDVCCGIVLCKLFWCVVCDWFSVWRFLCCLMVLDVWFLCGENWFWEFNVLELFCVNFCLCWLLF